jgi:hypothetical protein
VAKETMVKKRPFISRGDVNMDGILAGRIP